MSTKPLTRLSRLFFGLLLWAIHSSGMASGQTLSIVDTVCDVDFGACSAGVQGLRGVRSVVVSPDNAHVYGVSSLDDALLAFSRSVSTGELTLLQSLFDSDAGVDGLDSARGVAISPDGKHVYVAALLDASLAVFSRNAGSGMLSFVEVERDGFSGVDGLAGAHGVAVSPDGAHVYVASRSDHAVAVFQRDPATGAVTYLESHVDNMVGVDGLDNAEALSVSPDGKHVYVASEGDSAVAVFARETSAVAANFGRLSFVEARFDGVGGVDGLAGAGAVALDPSGRHVYVAAERGSLGGIAGDDWGAVFSRNAATGRLTFVQGFDESDFGTATTGIFAFCTGVGNENSGVAVSPDGNFVYYTNPYFGTVASFTRHPVTGGLNLAASICDLNFGTDGLAGALGITISPDGRHILTASSAFETVAVLSDSGIFFDGFESADLLIWTSAQP